MIYIIALILCTTAVSGNYHRFSDDDFPVDQFPLIPAMIQNWAGNSNRRPFQSHSKVIFQRYGRIPSTVARNPMFRLPSASTYGSLLEDIDDATGEIAKHVAPISSVAPSALAPRDPQVQYLMILHAVEQLVQGLVKNIPYKMIYISIVRQSIIEAANNPTGVANSIRRMLDKMNSQVAKLRRFIIETQQSKCVNNEAYNCDMIIDKAVEHSSDPDLRQEAKFLPMLSQVIKIFITDYGSEFDRVAKSSQAQTYLLNGLERLKRFVEAGAEAAKLVRGIPDLGVARTNEHMFDDQVGRSDQDIDQQVDGLNQEPDQQVIKLIQPLNNHQITIPNQQIPDAKTSPQISDPQKIKSNEQTPDHQVRLHQPKSHQPVAWLNQHLSDHQVASPRHHIPHHHVTLYHIHHHHVCNNHEASNHHKSDHHLASPNPHIFDNQVPSNHHIPDHQVTSNHHTPDQHVAKPNLHISDHQIASDQHIPDHQVASNQHIPSQHIAKPNAHISDHQISSDQHIPDHQVASNYDIPSQHIAKPNAHISDHHVASSQKISDHQVTSNQTISDPVASNQQFYDHQRRRL